MPIVLTKELLTYHCGYHGDLITMATRYVVDAYQRSQRTSIPNMDSIQLKTKGLQSKMCVTQTHRFVLIDAFDS